MTRIVVICTGGGTTGGVELLHQLVHTLTVSGVDACITYYPFFKASEVPAAYAEYRVPMRKFSDIEQDDSVYVVPEVLTYLLARLAPERCVVWWLSVDNYFGSATWRFSLGNFFLPWHFSNVDRAGSRVRQVRKHLYQSEYARLFLASKGLTNVLPLSDYINPQYIEAAEKSISGDRDDIILFNPAKGREQTERIMQAMPNDRFVPIVGMKREEVIELLKRSKIYLDFGNHPGKDRIPREAASLGCVVVTNRRGSASNNVDIPIPDDYKIDDGDGEFSGKVRAICHLVLADFAAHSRRFAHYRQSITQERKRFDAETTAFASQITCRDGS